jgi:hypothetical protein
MALSAKIYQCVRRPAVGDEEDYIFGMVLFVVGH